MSKLVVINEDKCIGCELCVMECQRQLGRAGLSGSYIRILRNIKEGDKFEVSLDPKVHELKIEKIVSICPRQVFAEEKDDIDTT